MLAQTISAKVDWQEPAWPGPEKSWQDLWGFKIPETEPVTLVTATNDLGAHLEGAYDRVLYWLSSWNTPTETSGTVWENVLVSGEPKVVFDCTRNHSNLPWLEELSEIRPVILKLHGKPSETSLSIITEPLTGKVEVPVAPSRQREIQWLSSNTEELETYQGKWIALEGDKIVAWGSDEVGVEVRARMQGIKVPFLVRVPLKDDIPFIGCGLHDNSNIR